MLIHELIRGSLYPLASSCSGRTGPENGKISKDTPLPGAGTVAQIEGNAGAIEHNHLAPSRPPGRAAGANDLSGVKLETR